MSEQFDTSFWTTGESIGGDALMNAACASVATHFAATARTQLRKLVRNDTTYTEIRGYMYVDAGPTADFVGSAVVDSGVGTSTFSGATLAQCMVVSLRTDLAGRRHRGRMFLPAHGLESTGHRFFDGDCDDTAAAMQAFFDAINADGDLGTVAVISVAGSSAEPVTQVQVNNAIDIQRRRENKLLPTHTAVETLA